MSSQPLPSGTQSVTAHLIVHDATSAIAFYTRAFGARELYRLVEPGGKIGHAELMIGQSRIMLCDEYPISARSAPRPSAAPPSSC